MAHEKIVTAFEQVQQAEAAREKLINEGIAEKNIDIISGEQLKVEDKEIRHPSFWQRLFGDDVDDNYASEYNKAIRSGGVLLTVRARKEDANHIEDELRTFAADYPSFERDSSRPLVGGGFAGETHDLAETDRPLTDAPYPPSVTPSDGLGAVPERDVSQLSEQERDKLQLAEENIEIGKRRVNEGAVRLRRYTVVDDVAEDVSLHDQHAEVFRHAVDDPAYLNDVDWSEKTVEVEESHEVPTIEKTARVKEEVGLRREETSRVETVKDSVRRQEVDIEHIDNERSGVKNPEDKKL